MLVLLFKFWYFAFYHHFFVNIFWANKNFENFFYQVESDFHHSLNILENFQYLFSFSWLYRKDILKIFSNHLIRSRNLNVSISNYYFYSITKQNMSFEKQFISYFSQKNIFLYEIKIVTSSTFVNLEKTIIPPRKQSD